MSMNSPRPTISRDLLLQRELLQQEPRTPGLGWGISDRRYLGSFTPALTTSVIGWLGRNKGMTTVVVALSLYSVLVISGRCDLAVQH